MGMQKVKNSKGNLEEQQWKTCTTQYKTYYKTIVIITEWNQHNSKATNGTKRTSEDIHMYVCMSSLMTSLMTKLTLQYSGGNDGVFNK